MEKADNHNHLELKNTDYNRAFGIGITLNVIYIMVETIFGLLINSMALIADAGHNLSDVLGLTMAWGAFYLSKTPITGTRTYGLRKSTILAALFNSLLLLIAVGAITFESVRKIIHPSPVAGTAMMIVAAVGVIINAVTALLFLKGKESDINIKGAFLHMAADAGISAGVVVAGLLINLTGFYLLDPIISLLIVIVITAGTWKLLGESFHLSMDAVPKGIDILKVQQYLNSLTGVKDVHDLHIWAISSAETALTVHLVIPEEKYADDFLGKVCSDLQNKFGIGHSTIQIEKSSQSPSCDDSKV
jgi:cobalt-zinc-cadmium efflux system protein